MYAVARVSSSTRSAERAGQHCVAESAAYHPSDTSTVHLQHLAKLLSVHQGGHLSTSFASRGVDCSQRLGVTPTYGTWAIKDDHIHLTDIFLLSIHYHQDQWVPEFYVFE